jgi:hypothetical protein
MWRRRADHGQKQDFGGETDHSRDLTQHGPLQKRYY